MPWITYENIEPIVRADLSADTYLPDLIDHVQGLAEIETGAQASPSTKLQAVFSQIVARFWRQAKAIEDNPEGVNQETIGGYSYSMPQSMTGYGLTNSEKKLLRKAIGKTQLWVQTTDRGTRLETAGPSPQSNAPADWDDWEI